jgi:hypothetical protein
VNLCLPQQRKYPLPCKKHSLYGEWSAILHKSVIWDTILESNRIIRICDLLECCVLYLKNIGCVLGGRSVNVSVKCHDSWDNCFRHVLLQYVVKISGFAWIFEMDLPEDYDCTFAFPPNILWTFIRIIRIFFAFHQIFYGSTFMRIIGIFILWYFTSRALELLPTNFLYIYH